MTRKVLRIAVGAALLVSAGTWVVWRGVAVNEASTLAVPHVEATAVPSEQPAAGCQFEHDLTAVPGDVSWYYVCGDARLFWASGRIPPLATFSGVVSHYGAGYEGQIMGCPPHAPYRSADPTIVAVSPARYAAWPCGTRFRVTGGAGAIVAVRTDACPGCTANWLDLSEAGALTVCGHYGMCKVTIEVLP